MSRFTGPQGRGATRKARERRRVEAEVRNALTRPGKRRAFRRVTEAAERIAAGAFGPHLILAAAIVLILVIVGI